MKIEGFFSGIKAANTAVEQLRTQGFKSAYSDINEHPNLNNDVRTKEFSFFSTSNLSDLVLNSGNPSGHTGESPMLAASPMASGMGNFEEIADVNYKVIVDSSEKEKEKVIQIINSLGGTIKNPNLDIYQSIEDVNLADIDTDFLKE